MLRRNIPLKKVEKIHPECKFFIYCKYSWDSSTSEADYPTYSLYISNPNQLVVGLPRFVGKYDRHSRESFSPYFQVP